MKRKSNFDVTPEQYAMMKQPVLPTAQQLPTTHSVALPAFLQTEAQLPPNFIHDQVANRIAHLCMRLRTQRYQSKLDAALKRSFDYVRRLDAIAAGLVPAPAVVAPPAFSKQFRQMRRPPASRARPGIGSTPKRVTELQATSVYVAGLPEQFTNKDLENLFSAYGKVTRCKFYKDTEGKPKGDALVTFAKPTSATNACKMNGFVLTPQYTITITPADFSRKRQEDAAKLPPECEADKFPVVLFRNMYIADDAQNDPSFFMDLETDLLEACVKFGKIRRIVSPGDDSFEGCIAVTFSDEDAAKSCADAMAGRFFDGHQIDTELVGSYWSPPVVADKVVQPSADATQVQQSESSQEIASGGQLDVAPAPLAGKVVMAAAPPDVRFAQQQDETTSGDPLAAFLESMDELEKSIS